MPHQCVRCSKMLEDGNAQILTGCDCGGKLFFFIKKEQMKVVQEQMHLSPEDTEQIEQDVYEVIGVRDPETPVILDLESIRVQEPGKYELDLVRMFSGDPLIFKVDDGKYIIDVAESFQKLRKKQQGQ